MTPGRAYTAATTLLTAIGDWWDDNASDDPAGALPALRFVSVGPPPFDGPLLAIEVTDLVTGAGIGKPGTSPIAYDPEGHLRWANMVVWLALETDSDDQVDVTTGEALAPTAEARSATALLTTKAGERLVAALEAARQPDATTIPVPKTLILGRCQFMEPAGGLVGVKVEMVVGTFRAWG